MDLRPNVPAWYQVAATIWNRIQRRSYKPGEMVPPEVELAREFAVSRTTMRRSLDELVRRGLLVRKRGLGTYVSDDPDLAPVECLGFLEDLLALFAGTEQGRLTQLTEPAPADIAATLELEPERSIRRIDRLRLKLGEPYALTRNYLPPEVSSRIELEDFEQLRLLEILSLRLGYELANASETIRATVADADLAAALAVPSGFPILHIRLVLYERAQTPVALTDLFFRGDMYEHRIKLAGTAQPAPG